MTPRPPESLEAERAGVELWVVRHGETTWNSSGRFQGQIDVPLSPKGAWQADRLAQRLIRFSFAAAYSSDLARCLQTAERLCQLDPALEITADRRLREIDVGRLGGLSLTEIERDHPEYLTALRADPWNTHRPGGESMAELFARCAQLAADLTARHPGQRVLAFTHGGVVRALTVLALGPAQASTLRLQVDNTSITRLILSPAGHRLVSFNDTAHLELDTWAPPYPAGSESPAGLG
jgi:probable phosphoglycerate mutase